MPSVAVRRSQALVTRVPKEALLSLCKMHQKTNCGQVAELNPDDPWTRDCCHKDYEKLRRMADGDQRKWRMFEMLGWCSAPKSAITKQMYAELAAFEKETRS